MQNDTCPHLVQNDEQFFIEGDLTFSTVTQIPHKLSFHEKSLQIDLSRLGRIDCAGLSLLIHWINLAKKQQKAIRFVNIPTQVEAVIKTRHLSGIFYANRTNQAVN